MRHLLLALLLGCGGSAFDVPNVRDVAQAFAPRTPRAMNWCCEGTRHGELALGCGYETKPTDNAVCYCAGIVSADAEECSDETEFTPGTLCTMSDEVCW